MELIMTTDLAKSLPKSIDFNHQQLKTELLEKLTYYKSLVVTEDSISSAKKDRAALNKLKTALDDKRKEVKNDCLTPFETFEKKVKELISMIDDPINAIDLQVKAFEDQKKAEKEKQIIAFYIANIGDLLSLLPFEKLNNARWLNATYKMADIEKEISDVIFKVKNDIAIIEAMGLGCEQQMLDKYLSTLNMSEALAEKTRFEEQQKRLKEYEESRRKAQEAAKEPEPKYINTTFKDVAEPQEPQEYIPEPEQCPQRSQAVEEAKTISVTFRDTTADFRREMSALCAKHGIKYGWAKKEDIE